jgi:hypothetical protein
MPKGTEEKKNRSPNTFEGKLVSAGGDKLVMASKDGKEHTHTLAKDAKLTNTGKACKTEDLTAGHKIRVTTKQDDRNVVTAVECLEKKDDGGKRH